MKQAIKVRVDEAEFSDNHEEHLSSVLTQVEEIVPENSQVGGDISGAEGRYEGRIYIKTKIGAFVAKATSRNLSSLITKLQTKLLRQVVNWREKRASKKRYQRRKHNLSLVPENHVDEDLR